MQAYDLQHLPHVFNDLVNLDCDNIEDSIGIDYDKDSSIILNDENSTIEQFSKKLFENFAIKNEKVTDNNSPMYNSKSYILCSDVIAYFREHIVNYKIGSESKDNSIEILKNLFYEHFEIRNRSEEKLFENLQLDFDSMHKIIQELIKRINLPNDSQNEIKQNTNDEFESFNFSIDEFKILDTQIRSNTRLRSSNIYRPHLRFDDDDFGLSAASSKQSLSGSSDDNLEGFDMHYDKEASRDHLEKKISSMDLKNFELESEISQLRQIINGLRLQSRNAEELNAQMAVEIEQKNQINKDLKIRYQDLANRFTLNLDENEQLQKMIVTSKSNVEMLMKEIDYVKDDAKYYQNELRICEDQISGHNLKNSDHQKVLAELNYEKKINLEYESNSFKLEESIKELKEQIVRKDQLIKQLSDEIKDGDYVIENLKEKNCCIEDNLARANQKLFSRNFYGSNETPNKENIIKKDSNEIGIEDETVTNACLVSEINENNFYNSLDDNDFRYEQFEHDLKSNNSKKYLNDPDKMVKFFHGIIILVDELKNKYQSLKNLNKFNHEEYGKTESILEMNDSFNRLIETILDYCNNNSSLKIQETIGNLIVQNQNLSQVNDVINKKVSILEKKNTCSKNQLNAMVIFIYKYLSLKRKEKESFYLQSNHNSLTQSTSHSNSLTPSYNQWTHNKRQKSFSAQNINFESFTISRVSPNTSDASNIRSSDLLKSTPKISFIYNNIFDEINKANEQSSDKKMNCQVKIKKGDAECKYLKRMNSFSVSNNEKDTSELDYSNNYEINNDQITFMTDDNESHVDKEDSLRFRMSFDTRNYANSTLLKPMHALDDNKPMFTEFYCRRCKYEQIDGKKDFEKKIDKSLSMSDIFNVSEGFKIEKYPTNIKQKNESTQTSFTNINEDSLQSQINILSAESKKDQSFLRHQLTRDSGIDSDNTHQLNTLKPPISENQQQNLLTSMVKENYGSQDNFTESKINRSNTTVTSNPQDKSKKNGNHISSSTRDNSIDGDYMQDNYNDDAFESDTPKKNDSSKSSSFSKDEFTEDEYIEDKYIGDEYKLGKNSTGDLSDSSADVENVFKERCQDEESNSEENDDIQSLNSDSENASMKRDWSKDKTNNSVITSTSLSKLARKIRKKNDKNLNDVSNLSIDEVLNLIERPTPSATFTSAVASFWSKGNVKAAEDDAHHNQLSKMRNIFKNKRANSIVQSESFDEYSATANKALMEHKLKTLESNFNQIAMAYHTDEEVIESCIDIYRDKFVKCNNHVSLIFEEIGEKLNKLAKFLDPNSSSTEGIEEDTQNSQKIAELFILDNITSLSKDMIQLRRKFANLITTSSMISGLKQEIHLMDLLKISISYVRELRRSTILNNVYPTGDSKQTFPKLGRSLSINPLAMNQIPLARRKPSLSFSKDSYIKSEYHHVRSKSTNEETEQEISPGKNRRSNWLKALSTIKSLSSTAEKTVIDSEHLLNETEIENLISKNDNLNLKENIDSNNESHIELGRSPLNSSRQNFQTPLTNDEVEIESEKSNINELSQKIEVSNPLETNDLNPSQSKINKRITARPLHKHLAKKSAELYGKIKEISQCGAQILYEDSFILVRQALSIFLLVGTFLYVVMTVGSELWESLFSYIFENIELKTYFETARST